MDIAAGPYFSHSRVISLAMMFVASSHDILLYLLTPRVFCVQFCRVPTRLPVNPLQRIQNPVGGIDTLLVSHRVRSQGRLIGRGPGLPFDGARKGLDSRCLGGVPWPAPDDLPILDVYRCQLPDFFKECLLWFQCGWKYSSCWCCYFLGYLFGHRYFFDYLFFNYSIGNPRPSGRANYSATND